MLEDCAPSLVAEAVLLYADPVASVEKTYHDHTLHNTIVPFHDGKTFVQKPNFTERPTDIGETNTKVHYVLSNDMREGLFDLSSYTTSVPQPIFGGAALPLHTKQNSNHTIENTSENSIRFLPDGTPLLSSLLGKEKVNSSNHTPSRLAELVRRSRQVSRYKRRYHATPCGRSGHVLHSLPTDYQPPLTLIEYNLEKCNTLSTSGTEKERNEDRTRILLSLRASVSAGQVSEKGYMILFGGLTSENKSMNDTWLYVVEHGVWLEVPCTAEEDIPPIHHHNNDNDTNAPPAPPFEFDEDGFMIAPETVGSEIASSEDGRWQEAEEEEIYYEQPFYEDEDGVMENRLYNAETLLRLNNQI
ncbi:Galactose oxidase, central domain containing protein, putative [Angomonas deanei]|uniref:Galactose oxidase, central domain containing protein, putative n=1 Tax=Angomonas deanei TaxID=59799 RepID=A0A7G2CQZ0_9TRYP|nr:Galactose oxidase, central domain containing protein, putative [Angomonas deanei]